MEYNENNTVVEEETKTEETSPATESEELREADDLIELYDVGDYEDSEEDEGMSTGTKVALGIGGIAAAALAAGGVLGLKKLKNRRKKPAESTPGKEAASPEAIPDSKPNAKAIRGRKITLRERLTGHLYLDPAEVQMIEAFRASQEEKKEDEES